MNDKEKRFLQMSQDILEDYASSYSKADMDSLARYIRKKFDEISADYRKQKPRNVTHEATLYRCCTCPNCKNVVDEFTEFDRRKVRVTPGFCRFCGQALDWSNE